MRRWMIALATTTFALTGCGDDGPTSPGDDGSADQAVVQGTVEQTHGSGSRVSASLSPAITGSGAAETAAVAAVRSDGSLDVLADASVDADGTFRVEGVPAGRSGLVVVARGDADAEVGRVLVHGQTQAGATHTVAPITVGTSAQGRAYGRLKAEGRSQAASNTGGLVLFARMADSAAVRIADSRTQATALARAYADGQAAFDAVASGMNAGLDAATRAQLLADLATQYAEQRDQGTSVEVAHEAFTSAALDAYADAGASAEQQALAVAGYASMAGRTSANAGSATHLAVTKRVVALHLRTRERLASGLSGSVTGGSADATVTALADARADVEASASTADVKAALDAASDEAETVVFDAVLGLVADADLAVQTEVESRLETAFAEAELTSRLEAAASASEVASIVATYRSDVRAAVDAVIEALPSGVTMDAEATTDLLIASHGGAAVH